MDESCQDMTAAVLFDLDGTLWLSEHRNRALWSIFLTKHGIPASDDFVQSLTGRRMTDVLTESSHLFPGRSVSELLAELFVMSGRQDLPTAAPAPGAAELIGELARHPIGIGIVTSALRSKVMLALDAMDVSHLIHTAVTFEDTERGKPHPDGYLMACERLGVPAYRSIAVEDSPVGIAAARSAGIWCIAIASSLPRTALGEADLIVDSLSEVTAAMVLQRLGLSRHSPGFR